MLAYPTRGQAITRLGPPTPYPRGGYLGPPVTPHPDFAALAAHLRPILGTVPGYTPGMGFPSRFHLQPGPGDAIPGFTRALLGILGHPVHPY